MPNNPPIPENEMKRLLSLADFDLDYSNFNENFKDLTQLAAKIADTEISLINLIDNYTQWSISNLGLDLEQMPREESVCQYTIMDDDYFEVSDLSADDRFKDKFYVDGPLGLNYYMGVPLKTTDGINIGALCVLDRQRQHHLSPEKKEMLKIIANEIVNRLNTYKAISTLSKEVENINATKKKVAHDIRGPLAGIIGLSEIISAQGKENNLDEVLDFVNLIYKSSKSLLELADEILDDEKHSKSLKEDQFNLLIFKDKLEKLYRPQAKNKQVLLIIRVEEKAAAIPFPKNKLLQITGNLISNAIKFTPINGTITVQLELKADKLIISISDTGIGINQDTINNLLEGDVKSTDGTAGEKGYGFGLALVKHLIDNMNGKLQITSKPNLGSKFEVILPMKHRQPV